MQEMFKDLEVAGKRYRLDRMTATMGAWILNVLITATMKSNNDNNSSSSSEEDKSLDEMPAQERSDGTVSVMWMVAATALSEEVYARIQSHCLKQCSQFLGEQPTPIMMKDGRWVAKELETDMSAVNTLVLEVLKFNIGGFFLENLSKDSVVEAAVVSNPPRSPLATGTSSVR